MTQTRFHYSDIHDGVCTSEQYAAQYPSLAPELGRVYAAGDSLGGLVEFEIVFRDDRVALGRRVGGEEVLTPYRLFTSTGPFAGFMYQDSVRPIYRIRSEVLP